MNLVKHILEDARRRLVVLGREASVSDAARILANANTPLVVVCDGEGMAVGVVSKTDIVRALTTGLNDAISANATAVMSSSIHSCDEGQSLQAVWETMGVRRLRCLPVLDRSGRPLGIVHARDLARALLDEITHEELLLRDYVLGIGYQ
jgi:CBS domain-containing protein